METKPLVIGIAGGSASGKTSVTNKIVERLQEKVVVLQHDSYYKDCGELKGIEKEDLNFDHPDSLETSFLIEHIIALKEGRKINQPVYDFITQRRLQKTIPIEPKKIIIIDGILIFSEAALRQLMNIKIFVDTPSDERLIRRIKRDIVERGHSVDSVMHQYLTTVQPMHLEFVEPSKRWADIIIPRGAENTVAIDMIVTKIKSMLSQLTPSGST